MVEMDTPIHAQLARKYKRRRTRRSIVRLEWLLPSWRREEVQALAALALLCALFLVFVSVTA